MKQKVPPLLGSTTFPHLESNSQILTSSHFPCTAGSGDAGCLQLPQTAQTRQTAVPTNVVPTEDQPI